MDILEILFIVLLFQVQSWTLTWFTGYKVLFITSLLPDFIEGSEEAISSVLLNLLFSSRSQLESLRIGILFLVSNTTCLIIWKYPCPNNTVYCNKFLWLFFLIDCLQRWCFLSFSPVCQATLYRYFSGAPLTREYSTRPFKWVQAQGCTPGTSCMHKNALDPVSISLRRGALGARQ